MLFSTILRSYIVAVVMAATVHAISQQAQKDSPSTRHTAVVMESMDAGKYTYMQVNEKGNIFWIAATKVTIKKGDIIGFGEQIWMEKFVSDSLNHTFEKLLFVSGVQTASAASAPQRKASRSTPTTPSNVSLYPLTGVQHVADLYKNAKKLHGQTVKVHGKIIKVMENIMGINWIHIQDSTSTTEHDSIIFTSKTASPEVGSIVTAKGVLAADRDFGYSYFYQAIVEDSTFTQ